MNAFQRWLVWSSSILTGLTGVVYAWMKYLMEPADPWSVINHPWEPVVLKAHILVAPVMVFAVGLIAADHIWRHWRAGVKAGRWSGLTALWVFAPMVFSGYLIQAVTDARWLRVLVWVHLVTGGLYLLGLGLHHRVFRSRRRPGEPEGEPTLRDRPPAGTRRPDGSIEAPNEVRRRRRQASKVERSAVSSASQTTKST